MLSTSSSLSSPNVRVALRVRPLNAKERLMGSSDCIYAVPGTCQVIANGEKNFFYDSVLDHSCSQRNVFEECVLPLMDKFVQGYNVTILAYGQTGSGKTFTMGTGLEGVVNEDFLGIVPRAVGYIFNYIHMQQSSSAMQMGDSAMQTCNSDIADKQTNTGSIQDDKNIQQRTFEIYVSFLEIYNEDIIDLLSPHSHSSKRPPLTIREDVTGEIYLAGLKEEPISCSEDIFELLKKGTLCRTTGSTDMNLNSSRSHAIFTIVLRQIASSDDQATISKIHFVDLAGSERLKRTNAVGNRARESISINSGLLALGNVISALSDDSGRTKHIPYRNSKLTRLLQDSLGGNSHTVMIACISPSSDNFSESVSTLNYASRARNIRNKAVINQQSASNSAFEVSQLKKQISALKQEILLIRGHASQLEESDVGILQRQYDELLREKMAIEIERDSLLTNSTASNADTNPIVERYVRTINELKSRISDLERIKTSHSTVTSSVPQNPFCPSTPAGMTPKKRNVSYSIHDLDTVCQSGVKIGDLTEKLRLKIGEISNLNDKSQRCFQFGETVDSLGSDLVEFFSSEASYLEEMLFSIEQLKKEYASMKLKYDEKIKQLQDSNYQALSQRDEAIRQLNIPPQSTELTRIARNRYEERIKKLNSELKESKDKIIELQRQSKTKGTSNELLVKNLKSSLEVVKNERNKLQQKLSDEVSKKSNRDFEIKESKNKEKRAAELVIKWKKAFELQKEILAKRNDQINYAKQRIKNLTSLLKTLKTPIDSVSSASNTLSKILLSPSHISEPDLTSDTKSLCIDDDFFIGESEVVEFLNGEIEKIKELIGKELKESEISSKIIQNSISPLRSPQEYKQFKFFDNRRESLLSLLAYFSNSERMESLIEETIKSLQRSKPSSPFKKTRILPYFHHSIQIQLHHKIIELKQTLKRAIECNNEMDTTLNSPLRYTHKSSNYTDNESTPTKCPQLYQEHTLEMPIMQGIGSSSYKFVPSSIEISPVSEQMEISVDSGNTMSVERNDAYGNESYAHSTKFSLSPICTLEGHLGQVFDLLTMEDYAYSCSQDGTVKIWSLPRQTLISNFCTNLGMVRAIKSYESATLFTAANSVVKRWDISSGSCTATFSNHSDDVFSLHILNNYLFSGSFDATVSVWDLRMNLPVGSLTGHQGTVLSITSIPENDIVISGSRDNTMRIYNLNNFAFKSAVDLQLADSLSAITKMPLEDSILSVSRDHSIKKWQISGGLSDDELICVESSMNLQQAHSDWIKSVGIVATDSSSPTAILTGDKSGIVKVWDDQFSDRTIAVQAHSAIINCIDCRADIQVQSQTGDDASLVVTGSGDRTLKVWRLSDENKF